MANGFKTGGRQPGTPNKKTLEVMEAVSMALNLIAGDAQKLEKDILSLSPNERMKLYSNLLEYVKPKLARVEANFDKNIHGGTTIIVVGEENESEAGIDLPGAIIVETKEQARLLMQITG